MRFCRERCENVLAERIEGERTVNTVLFELLGANITAWKLIGYFGTFLFAGRWLVQMRVSRNKRKPVVPRMFWYMSITGSVMLLSYFIFGKNDSVGILSNAFPCAVALYNLYLDLKSSKQDASKNNNEPATV